MLEAVWTSISASKGGSMIRIGGATGYWGEADLALPQFLAEGDLDFIVFDYLAEITMSIMARAKRRTPRGVTPSILSARLWRLISRPSPSLALS